MAPAARLARLGCRCRRLWVACNVALPIWRRGAPARQLSAGGVGCCRAGVL